jgi:hypothetical protein
VSGRKFGRSFAIIIAALLLSAAAPAQSPARWRLIEEWRIGGAADGAYSFNDVRGLGILKDGRIVLVENKDKQVRFYDARGRHLRTVGRSGAGPGEYANANGLVVSPTGEIIVKDVDNARFTFLTSTGDFVRTMRDDGGFGFHWEAGYNAKGRLDEVAYAHLPGSSKSQYARRVWSADFASADTTVWPLFNCPNIPQAEPNADTFVLRRANGGGMMKIPFLTPRLAFTPSTDGSLWWGRWPDYGTIEKFTSRGCEPVATIHLRGERAAVPDSTLKKRLAQIRKQIEKLAAAPPDYSRVPHVYPLFDALFVDPSTRLWVERPRSNGLSTFDVFSPAGSPLATLDSPVTFGGGWPFVITGDHIYAFTPDEDDVMYLISLRIVR